MCLKLSIQRSRERAWLSLFQRLIAMTKLKSDKFCFHVHLSLWIK